MKHLVSSKKQITNPRSVVEKSTLKSPLKSAKVGEEISKKVVSSKKTETKSVEKKTVRNSVQMVKPTAKKTVSVQPPKKVKIGIATTPRSKVRNARTEKTATVEIATKKNQPTDSKRNTKINTEKFEIVVAAKTAKPENQKFKLTETSKKAEIAAAKRTPTVLKKSAKAQSKKNQPIIAAKKIAIKDAKPKSTAPVIIKSRPSIKKVKAAIAIENSGVKTLGKINKLKTVEADKKVEFIESKTKPKNPPALRTARKTTNKPVISVEENKVPAKTKNQIIAPAAQMKNLKVIEDKIENLQPVPVVKPKNKKAKPISSAVFRGKKDRYDFKVFALSEIFEPIPAVYIISKRVTDKRKKGHHALICIGATNSISDELRKHRKGKCVKKYAANVVSILPEADEKIRLKIETDLKAAHSVICSFE